MLAVNHDKRICYCAPTWWPGAMNDQQRMLAVDMAILPSLRVKEFRMADRGFYGVPRTLHPYRRKKGQLVLHPFERAWNSRINRLRWPVENGFSVTKKWRIRAVPQNNSTHKVHNPGIRIEKPCNNRGYSRNKCNLIGQLATQSTPTARFGGSESSPLFVAKGMFRNLFHKLFLQVNLHCWQLRSTADHVGGIIVKDPNSLQGSSVDVCHACQKQKGIRLCNHLY